MSAGYGIDQLKSTMSKAGGFAMGNLFMVQLPSLKSFPVEGNTLDLMCTVAALPGRQIMSMDYPMGTRIRKIANGYTTTDLSLTFLVSNNHLARRYFEAWQAEAHNPTTRNIGYYEDYTYPVRISTVQKGTRSSLFKKNFPEGYSKVPPTIKNAIGNLGPIDFSQGEIDLGVSFDMKKTFTCRLEDCYPTTLSEQQLGNTQEGVLELTVQLSFSDWESEGGEYFTKEENLASWLVGVIAGRI